MLDSFIHVNSRNEKLDFLKLGIYANENELRDFEYSYDVSDSYKIKKFYKGVVTKTIPFVFNCDEEQASEIKNKFYEHFDYDVVTRQKGYFEINGYRLYCYAYKSSKSSYTTSKRLLNVSLEIVTDEPQWRKDTLYTLNFIHSEEVEGILKYPFKYPFIYYDSMNTGLVNNGNFTESEAIIRVYGPCDNPIIRIADNIYAVATSVAEGEFFEIDTEEKTIYQFDIYGNPTNIFNLRNKEYDCFLPVPSGQSIVSANDTLKVDIQIREYRGEPKWN